MSAASDLVARLTSPDLDPHKLRAFAEHVAAVEAQTGIRAKNALVNGIPPFEAMPTVEFDVPREHLGDMIARLLDNGPIRPSVVVVGSPNIDGFEVRVAGGR